MVDTLKARIQNLSINVCQGASGPHPGSDDARNDVVAPPGVVFLQNPDLARVVGVAVLGLRAADQEEVSVEGQ